MLLPFVISISPKAHHCNYLTFFVCYKILHDLEDLLSGFLHRIRLSKMPEHVLLLISEINLLKIAV